MKRWNRSLLVLAVVATLLAVTPSSAAQVPSPYTPPLPATGALVTPSGVVVAVQRAVPGGWVISTPCTNVGVVTEGTFVPRADVVLDPGHGGSESGAVGSNGLVERDLNLSISVRVEQLLEAGGFTVQRTRTKDYRLPIRSRADIANALAAPVFVSIHHNGGAVAKRSTPGSEVYFQPGDAQSQRLATLMWDENFRAMSAFGSDFVGTHYAGTVTRHREDGEPLHGVLRYTPDLVSVITEPLYLSNPPEAALLAGADVQEAEAQAIANAITRWFADAPSVDAKYTRVDDASSTGTGGTENCTDPDLGTPLLQLDTVPVAGPSRFVGNEPQRLFDTRFGPGPIGKLGAGETIDVTVAGAAGVPSSGASAVVLNVTGTEATDDGFVTVWPHGYTRPLASSLNLTTDQTAPNLVVVPLGTSGRVSFYSQSGTHLVADVLGWFTEETTTPGGRYVAVPPTRVFDTREGSPSAGPVEAKSSIVVPLAGTSGLPSAGVSSVVLNLTATEATAPGFVTVWSGEGDRPTASTLNMETAGDEAANLVVVPWSADGSIEIYTQRGAHLVGDIVGYFTDATGTAGSLYVPLTPARAADTRTTAAPSGYVGRRSSVDATVLGVAGVPLEGVDAVMSNVTAVATGGAGFITAWSAGAELPLVSTLNVDGPYQNRPNAAIVAPGSGGAVSLYAHSGAHLVFDVYGYFAPE